MNRKQSIINFVLNDSPHYLGIQAQILDQIKRHLPDDSWRESSRVYVEGCFNFTLFIRFKADAFMSHGVADKNYHWKKTKKGERYNLVRRRSHLLVPGQWLQNRIVKSSRLDFDREHVHVVGWPRLDILAQAKQRESNTRRGAARRRRVLWAPTHDFNLKGTEKRSTSSYPAFEEFLPALREHFDVAVSLHPRNRQSKKPTDQKLLDADFVIADFGTIVYEAWALGKPVIFPHWLIGKRVARYLRTSTEGYIYREDLGLHASSFDQLVGMLSGRPTIDRRTRGFLDRYLAPEYFGSSGKRIAQLLLQLAE